jgi:hypothetical protein
MKYPGPAAQLGLHQNIILKFLRSQKDLAYQAVQSNTRLISQELLGPAQLNCYWTDRVGTLLIPARQSPLSMAGSVHPQ